MRNPFKSIPPVEIPPLLAGEGEPNESVGSLRVRIWQSNLQPFEWYYNVEIFDAENGYPHWNRWMPWSYWVRDIAAQRHSWRRDGWPETFGNDETEEGAKAKACAMLRAVREFVPVIVPEVQYLTEADCDG